MKNFKLLTLLSIFFSINVSAQISFTMGSNPGCADVLINFNNTSSSGVFFDWDMGDGTYYSNQLDVTHTYSPTGGNFTVTLYAYDAGMVPIGSWSDFIQIDGPPPNFSGMPNAACPGDQVVFDAWMPNTSNYQWDFGDGTTLSTPDNYVLHTYNTPGVYYPTTTITSGCGTYVVEDTIIITNSLPFFGYPISMDVYPGTACPNDYVNYSVTDGFSSYSWDFGDGNFAFDTQGNHMYTTANNYNVQLTVTNGCGIDTTLNQNVLVDLSTPVINSFLEAPDTVCPGQLFNIWGGADNDVTHVWDMDDGSGPITFGGFDHTYSTVGTYNITLTLTNNCGNNEVINHTIVVDGNAQITNGFFDVYETTVCPEDLVSFSTNGEYTYYIDYGDGTGSTSTDQHGYTNPGIYVASVTLQNACGNSITLFDTINVVSNLTINPNNIWYGADPIPVCPNDEVEFDAVQGYSAYYWDFGDGSTSTNQEVDHIYNAAGVYNVTLGITNGCGDQYFQNFSVTVSNNVPIDDVYYNINADTICPGNAVFFEADEQSDTWTYEWDFGDGTTSMFPFISHTYSAPGVYQVELTVTNGCGVDSVVVDSVVVSNSYVPNAGSSQVFAQQEGCLGDELYFVLMPSGAGTITWDFGDGTSTSTTQVLNVLGTTPVDVAFHAYSAIGQYWAVYTLTNACGNSYTDSLLIDIGTVGDNQDMDVFFWWDESQAACQGQPIEFTAVGGADYIWDFGDGSGQLLSTGSLIPVTHIYQDPGFYTVSCTALNQCGNTDQSDETIFIPQSQMNITTNTVTEPNCGQLNGMAVASVTGGMPPYNFSWTNGDVGVIADSLGSGVVTLTVTDNNGCSQEAVANVSDQEGVTILVDNVVNVDCYGASNGSIAVTLLGGQPPYTVLWDNGDQTEDIYNLEAATYVIYVTDANGCFAVESVEVTQPPKTTISIITQPATCGMSDGTASASVNNGTPPYNYIWPNTGGPSSSTGGLSSGYYNLMVIDGNTCLLQKEFAINETNGPIIVTDSTVLGTCNGALSSMYISTIGGQQPFSYNWSNSTNNQDLTNVQPGNYTVQVTGADGCSSYAGFVVEEGKPDETSICMVDVDTTTNYNLVVWEPLMDPGVEFYKIYRESSESGVYFEIGQSSADSISQFLDTISDPFIRSWRYKVAAVDDCGNEAEWSDYHKTIHLTANKGVGGEVNLIWDHYEGFAYSTYYIRRWHPTTQWETIDSIASNLFSYTDFTPPGDSSLVYMIQIKTPNTCTAQKAQDYNNSRSNRGSINFPDLGGASIEEEEMGALIYPNPSNGMVNIRYEGLILSYQLYDMSGKLILSDQNTDQNVQIDMGRFERGVYSIQLQTNNGLINAKIIRD